MHNIKDIIQSKSTRTRSHYRYEFQVYGEWLAKELGDVRHLSLYMRLAKTMNRKWLERAREFVKAAGNLSGPSARAKLFMWKLTQLKKSTH